MDKSLNMWQSHLSNNDAQVSSSSAHVVSSKSVMFLKFILGVNIVIHSNVADSEIELTLQLYKGKMSILVFVIDLSFQEPLCLLGK